MNKSMKIGELAKATGLTTKTIRYYELHRLLEDPERTESGYRMYGEADVERIVLVVRPVALAEEYEGKIKFVKVDTEENFETPSSYGILSLPTLLVFKEGQQIERITGARPKGDLKRSLDKALA